MSETRISAEQMFFELDVMLIKTTSFKQREKHPRDSMSLLGNKKETTKTQYEHRVHV